MGIVRDECTDETLGKCGARHPDFGWIVGAKGYRDRGGNKLTRSMGSGGHVEHNIEKRSQVTAHTAVTVHS